LKSMFNRLQAAAPCDFACTRRAISGANRQPSSNSPMA
jgi:hypothetical protein